jgi:hypothetical protein
MSLYRNITLEYVRFVKQFVTCLAYVQFNRMIYNKTEDILNYIARPDDNILETTNKIFHKIRQEERYSIAIWTDIFREPNIAIPLLYFIDLYNSLSSDLEKTHTQRMIEKTLTLFTHNSRVFQNEPFKIPSNNVIHEASLSRYASSEQHKYIRNSIVYDVLKWIDTSICETDIDTRPYYSYIKYFIQQTRKNGISITNEKGNLEITADILQQHAIQAPQTQTEIYSIWLIDQWLS